MGSKKIIFIVGPTAVGKSDVAVCLARMLGGEIVSCDAMQVYKEITIASNKPSSDILREVPHHLLGIIGIGREFDVAAFNRRALAAIRGIQRRGKLPVIVGGSGMYMQVLLDGIFEQARPDQGLRMKLEQQVRTKGKVALYRRLRRVDPAAAARIHPNDLRRIIRALEVYLAVRSPLSQVQKFRSGLWGKQDIAIYALNMDRAALYDRINRRVDRMFDEGLVEEVRRLARRKLSRTAEGIIGLKEIREYLDGGYDLERAKYLIKRNTRHLAKRQLTWFRKDRRLQWVMVEEKDSPAVIAERIRGLLRGPDIGSGGERT